MAFGRGGGGRIARGGAEPPPTDDPADDGEGFGVRSLCGHASGVLRGRTPCTSRACCSHAPTEAVRIPRAGLHRLSPARTRSVSLAPGDTMRQTDAAEGGRTARSALTLRCTRSCMIASLSPLFRLQSQALLTAYRTLTMLPSPSPTVRGLPSTTMTPMEPYGAGRSDAERVTGRRGTCPPTARKKHALNMQTYITKLSGWLTKRSVYTPRELAQPAKQESRGQSPLVFSCDRGTADYVQFGSILSHIPTVRCPSLGVEAPTSAPELRQTHPRRTAVESRGLSPPVSSYTTRTPPQSFS